MINSFDSTNYYNILCVAFKVAQKQCILGTKKIFLAMVISSNIN